MPSPSRSTSSFYRRVLVSLLALTGAVVPSFASTPASAATTAAAPMGTEVRLRLRSTSFAVPTHVAGDREFGAHGPRTEISVRLVIRNQRELWAEVGIKARETTNDWTEARGTTSLLVHRFGPAQRIEQVVSPSSATLSYVDSDHEEDYVVPGRGEVRPQQWRIPSADGLVRMARAIGDTNGAEAGTRTGVQIFFNDISLRVSGTPPMPARKRLAVSDAEREGFPNGCAASAAWRVLAFYGKTISHRAVYDRIASSSNIVTDNHWGAPPGTLRDRLRDLGLDVQEYRVPDKNAAIARVRAQIDRGRPVIALTGWGGKAVRDLYAPVGDTVSWDLGASTLHFVVVHGYDAELGTLNVLDNGTPKIWTNAYFQNLLFWSAELHAAARFEATNVRNATLIY